MLESLSKYRRFVVTGLLVLFSLVFLGYFPQSDGLSPVFQGVVISVAFFLVIPLLYSKLVLGESLENIGLQKGNFGSGVLTAIFSIALAMAIVIFLASVYPDFRKEWAFPALVEKSFLWFVFYELALTSLIVLLYEVFFRGLIELLWLKEFGLWAVFIQTGLFLGFAYLSHDVSWQRVPILIFCPFAGFIAYRSRSLWYSALASWTFLFLTDIFFLIFH